MSYECFTISMHMSHLPYSIDQLSTDPNLLEQTAKKLKRIMSKKFFSAAVACLAASPSTCRTCTRRAVPGNRAMMK